MIAKASAKARKNHGPKRISAIACAESPAPSPAGLPFRARVLVRMRDIGHCGDICNLLDAWGYERECACSDEELPKLMASDPAIVICDPPSLGQVAKYLPLATHSPLLLAVGEEAELTDLSIKVDARLSAPARPARLRALLHHLLLEDDDEFDR